MKRKSSPLKKVISLFVMLVFVLGTMSFVGAASVTPVLHEGNYQPSNLQGKVEVTGGSSLTGSISVMLNDVSYSIEYTLNESKQLLSFSASSAIVKSVLVKGSVNTYEFTYDDPVASDSGLYSPDTPSGNLPTISWFGFILQAPPPPPDEPAINVTKVADDDLIPATGQDVTFTFRITNTGPVDVVVTSISDNVFGDLLATAETLNGGEIYLESSDPDDYFEFTYTAIDLEPEDGLDPHNNTVVVTADDIDEPETDPVVDEASETVSFYNPEEPPELSIAVTKVVDDDLIPYTGQGVTFTFTITNTGPVAVMVTSISDSVFGNLLPEALADNDVEEIYIPAAGSVGFTFATTLSSTIALTPHTNTITVTADDVGDPQTEPATAQATEIVNFFSTPPPPPPPPPGGPDVDLVKDVNLTSGTAPATFVYTITITNTGNTKFSITSLADTQLSPLPANLQELIGTELEVGQSVSRTYTVQHDAAGSYPNTATVNISDIRGVTDSDSDTETVTVLEVAGALVVFGAEMPTTGDSGPDAFALAGLVVLLVSGAGLIVLYRKQAMKT